MGDYNKSFGALGEEIACKYLVSLGYKIIEQNYYIWGGEIDVVASFKSEIIFCEIKTRFDENDVYLQELISNKKKRTLIKTCRLWLLKHGCVDNDWRIDFIGIIMKGDRLEKLEHLKGAIW